MNASRLLACIRTPCWPRTNMIITAAMPISRTVWITGFMLALLSAPGGHGHVEEDVDAVDQRLPLRPGVVGVEPRHRPLPHPPRRPGQHGRDLRGVRHAVLRDPQ